MPRELSEEHTLQAIKHVHALRRIHKTLDGVEWSPDTLDEIGVIIEGAGYEIHAPEDVDEVWSFPATIYITIANGPLEVQEVTQVTVQPIDGTTDMIVQYNDDQVQTDRNGEDVEGLLAKYLDSVIIEGEDFFGFDATYPLRWEG